MTSRTLIFAAATACSAFCLWQNAQQGARVELARTELTAIASDCRPIEVTISDSNRKIASAEKDILQLKQSIALLEKIEFVDATTPEKPEETVKKETDSIAEQEQKARGYRTHLVSQYAPFYYRAGLTDAQIDRLETILTDHWQSTADIKAIVESKKLEDDDASVAELRRKADQTLHDAEKELLDEEGFQRFQNYERTLGAREFVASVAENLYFTETPLDANQAEKIVGVLVENNASFKKGTAFSMDETDWPKVREQMPTILSAKQHAGFMRAHGIFAELPQWSAKMEKFFKPLSALFEEAPEQDKPTSAPTG